LEADIVLAYRTGREADAVCRAVSPDNMKVPKDLLVKTRRRGKKVFTKIKCTRNMLRFIATIDDFMDAVAVAQKSISAVNR